MFSNNNLSSEHLTTVAVGLIIVFSSLTILYLVFQNLPKLLTINFKKLIPAKEKKADKGMEIRPGTITMDETAAISAAIFLFIAELHDEENTVLTIRKMSKKYSPWNSKIYNVINGLNKRF